MIMGKRKYKQRYCVFDVKGRPVRMWKGYILRLLGNGSWVRRMILYPYNKGAKIMRRDRVG